jgi:PhoH-like ATPase
MSFEDNDVIIPMIVLEELDRHKSRQDEVGQNARSVSRALDDLRKNDSNLYAGVQLKSGGLLKVATIPTTDSIVLPLELQAESKVDNLIIAFMLKTPGAILVSKDINVRLKCDALQVKCEDYLKMRVASDPKKFYRGVEVVQVTEELIDQFYVDGSLSLDAVKTIDNKSISAQPNQIIILKNEENGTTVKSAITKCVTSSGSSSLLPTLKIDHAFNLKPRNKEQAFSLDLLFDENIKLLTLSGPAGCGKTLLAIAAALEQLKGLGNKPRYDKLIVSRPVQPMGRDIGFLPGTLEEKMEPWIAPIRDNINYLVGIQKSQSGRRSASGESKKGFNEYYLQLMQEKGLIEIEALTYIRGRSIPNSFIILDEAQNLSMHELKTIITRVGDNTKIVLTGDIDQIDNTHVDVYTNGLTYAIEKFKSHPIAGHITLQKGERSPLATIASQILLEYSGGRTLLMYN